MSRKETFSLLVEEEKYIANLVSEDESFADVLRLHPDIYLEEKKITASRIDIEVLRGYFTERLARVGFDTDSRPNTEGVMLERLINRLGPEAGAAAQ